MRGIILAVLVAVGIGLAATPTVNAAPANGMAISNDAAQTSNVTKVQHWRYYSHRRWGSGGYHGGGCHVSGSSRWVRC